MLPILNAQIRQAVTNSVNEEPTKTLFTVILCHSFIRCQEISDTLKELVTFCTEMIEIINLDTGDFTETQLKLKKSL